MPVAQMPGSGAYPESSRRFDALIFDLGSTLIYFDGGSPEIFKKADAQLIKHLLSAGLKLVPDSFLNEFHARMENYFHERESEFIEYTTAYILRTLLVEHGYPDISDSTIRDALDAMSAVTQEYWRVEEDTHPTLKKLREMGYRLGLISNTSDDHDVQNLIDKAGIRPYFEAIRTSAALGIRKPNPLIFNSMLSEMKVEPYRVAMIGDTLGADILGAHNAGMFGIWITRRADKTANSVHKDTIHPEATIARLSELPVLLKELG